MRDRDSILLENAYNRVINEISASYVDSVKDAIADKELPLGDIFGNKLRLKLPIEGTETYKEILQQISKIKNYDHFDPQKKEVVKKIKVDPKFGGGEKFQRINLGRAISLLSLPEDQKKKMLDWFANYSTNIPEMEDMGKYTIVLSRAPIDVLRMSDIGNITSCHSQGGQYFHCAVVEAKKGGPIAYVVKTKDLEKLSEEEFQFDEIFRDPERDVEGIDAISRLRIRRYVNNDTGESIGIPETKIYGTRISGFYKTVKDFLKSKQFSEETPNNISAEFKARKLTRTGGSYSDSSDSHLFNQMFDTNTFYGSLPTEVSEEDESDRYEQFQNELTYMQNSVAFKGFNTWFNVEQGDDGYVYYDAGASLRLDLDKLNIEPTKEFFECLKSIDSHYGMSRIRQYDPTSQYAWLRTKPYGFEKKDDLLTRFKKFMDDFEKMDPTNFVKASYGMSHLYTPYYTTKKPKYISLECCFGDDCGGTEDDTDKYREFLDDVVGFDEKYKEIIKAFVKALRINGFDANTNIDDVMDESDLRKDLKVFELEEYGHIQFKRLILIGETPKENSDYEKNINNRLQQDYKTFLENYLSAHYKPQQTESPKQMKFKGFLESIQNKKTLEDYGINIQANIYVDDYWRGTKPDETSFTLNVFYSDILDKKTYDVLIFLDKNSDDLINAAKYYMFYEVLGKLGPLKKSQYTENLRKLYGKYFINS